MKKVVTYASKSESSSVGSVQEKADFSSLRPQGYFSDALTVEDIRQENLIAEAVAQKNASHRASE